VIVLLEPVIDDGLSLLDYGDPVGLFEPPTQVPIEQLVVSVFPIGSRVDADRFDAPDQRVSDILGWSGALFHLRSLVASMNQNSCVAQTATTIRSMLTSDILRQRFTLVAISVQN
jgi:hypothetical protein